MLKYAFAEQCLSVNWVIQISFYPGFVASGRALYPYKAMKISFETSPNKFSFLLCLQ